MPGKKSGCLNTVYFKGQIFWVIDFEWIDW
jgi:hypothetical protein